MKQCRIQVVDSGAPGFGTTEVRAALLDLVVQAGLTVVEQHLEAERAQLCGPRYAHGRGRPAQRAGTAPSAVVLGGRKVALRRPRVRAGGREVVLPTFAAIAATDPLTQRAVEQMLVGVATRRYARSLEPIPVATWSTSKSAVSRRFVAHTQAQLETWRGRSLAHLDLVALFLDGAQFAKHCVVVALGVDATGTKHVLGLWDGATENASVCQALLDDLQERGLRMDRSILVTIDGSKALAKAITATWGPAAWVQRCQVHKMRNVLDHVPRHAQAEVRAVLRRAYGHDDVAVARRLLTTLADRLDRTSPTAAGSLREGLEDTLTVLTLDVSPRLRRSLATTNAIESLMSRIRRTHRQVTRWRGVSMILRWAVAGLREAERGFHRLFGAKEIGVLVRALRRRDQQLQLNRGQSAA